MEPTITDFRLPKWPALVVLGKTISSDQAAEIIIRTDGFYFSTNDRDFRISLYKALGIALTDHEPNHNDLIQARNKYQLLPLDYLNNSWIVSSWIGGAHGWCNWRGNLHCNNYNIGKWPTAGDVLQEWALIALAFPFLSLRCQLFNGEVSDNTMPVIEYIIENGTVQWIIPTETIQNPTLSSFTSFVGEIGCTLNQFQDALRVVEKSLTLTLTN